MSGLRVAARVCRADQIGAADLGAHVEFEWGAAQMDGQLLGFTKTHVAEHLLSDIADALLPVQLLTEVGSGFGPQWFDVDESTEVRVTRSGS